MNNVVRVARAECTSDMRDLVESLRCAGLVRVHNLMFCSDDVLCFDILPPSSVHDTENWADRNAEYMWTLGFTAAKVQKEK